MNEGEEDSVTLLSQIVLHTIWDDENVRKSQSDTGRRVWTCGFCDKVFVTWNATKALAHVLRIKGVDIAVCHAPIPAESHEAYVKLKSKIDDRKRKRDSTHETMARHVRAQQQEVVDMDAKMPARRGGFVTPSLSSTTDFSSPATKTNSTWTHVSKTCARLYCKLQ